MCGLWSPCAFTIQLVFRWRFLWTQQARENQKGRGERGEKKRKKRIRKETLQINNKNLFQTLQVSSVCWDIPTFSQAIYNSVLALISCLHWAWVYKGALNALISHGNSPLTFLLGFGTVIFVSTVIFCSTWLQVVCLVMLLRKACCHSLCVLRWSRDKKIGLVSQVAPRHIRTNTVLKK